MQTLIQFGLFKAANLERFTWKPENKSESFLASIEFLVCNESVNSSKYY